ncbi:MAG: T9SS type A sorting domain-containing protein [Bacteroides sp.]|nr:T9SS type A sorting domain-containing protein [Ruminococcus flavefaciens]MCM1555443.1 T9SS type A sorting domain-containing protein [Bacteroides sp.]
MKRFLYLSMKTLLAMFMMLFATKGLFAQDYCAARTAPRELQAYESNESVVLTWSEPESTADFVGFNLYRDGRLISQPSFIDLRYRDEAVELNTRYAYRLEAFYDGGCRASDSVAIILTGQGIPQPPATLKVKALKNADSAYDVTLSWDLPYFEEPMAYGYCGMPVGGANPDPAYQTLFCCIGWNDMDLFDEDLYLVGLEFVPGTQNFQSFSTVVFVDDKLMYSKPFNGRFYVGEWNRIYFDIVVKMKQEEEIAVGYSASCNFGVLEAAREYALVYDLGPGKRGYSDLISVDGGATFTTLNASGIDANLCINALVVRQRDLDESVAASDPQAYLQQKAVRIDARKTSSKEVKLVGFNVYRDMVKLNDTLVRDLTFVDSNLICRGQEECGYEYRVSAVYEGGQEEYSDYSECYLVLSRCDTFVPKAIPAPIVTVMVKKGEDILLRGEDAQTAIYYGIGEDARPTIPYTGGILIKEPTVLRAISVVGRDTSAIITLDCKVFEPEEPVVPSLNETNGLAGVNIYPNPTDGEFSIDVPVEVTLEFYDAGGKLFARNPVGSGTHTYTLHDSGVYMIRAIAQDGRATIRRIVVR